MTDHDSTHRERFMTTMHETPDDKILRSGGDDVDNDAGESLDTTETKAPEDAPSQPATIAPVPGRSANIGH